jgi:hypothetical protein
MLGMTVGQMIVWWELRRILYNAVLLVIGVSSIAAMEIIMNDFIPRGEDAVEPLALVFGVVVYGFMANVCYTFGWITELLMRKGDPERARRTGRRLFKLGLAGSCVLTTFPLWIACLEWIAAKA